MTSIDSTFNLDNENSKEEFRTKTYEMLSTEFQQLCPKVDRAYQLVALMYNRLTLIENLSHKQARSKIVNDHKHVPGFSERNVRRYLPSNNPNVPHRVRPSWPKKSNTEVERKSKLNATEHKQAENTLTDYPEQLNIESSGLLTFDRRESLSRLTESGKEITSNSQICPKCEKLVFKNNKKIRMLEQALKKATLSSTAQDICNMSKSETDSSISPNKAPLTESDLLCFEFSIPFKELELLMINLSESDDLWFSGKICKNSGVVLSHKTGRLENIR